MSSTTEYYKDNIIIDNIIIGKSILDTKDKSITIYTENITNNTIFKSIIKKNAEKNR
jgi:hypothetical protein